MARWIGGPGRDEGVILSANSGGARKLHEEEDGSISISSSFAATRSLPRSLRVFVAMTGPEDLVYKEVRILYHV